MPLSYEEEDWEISMLGFSDEVGRQVMSEDSGSGGKEEPGRPGESRAGKILALDMPVRRVGVAQGFMTILKQLYVADLHKSSPYMCALATRFS